MNHIEIDFTTKKIDRKSLQYRLFEISSLVKSSILDFDMVSFSENLFKFIYGLNEDTLTSIHLNALLKISHDILLTFCFGLSVFWFNPSLIDDVEDIWEELTQVLLGLVDETFKFVD